MRTSLFTEEACALAFAALGTCYHLWTPEDFEVIFTDEDGFKVGMTIIGICSKMVPDVRILTFELMSNHIHITASGKEDRIMHLFNLIKSFIMRWTRANGRDVRWESFIAGIRQLATLDEVRNVIVYDNRNGFVVNPSCTPFSYRWGANRFYFNPDAKELAQLKSKPMSLRDRQRATRSRKADRADGLLSFEGYALPLSFCEIDSGERLFRSPSQYFFKISRSVETSKGIARELHERVFYTDDELFRTISSISRKKYGTGTPSQTPAEAKIELAKLMHYEYNATLKQISRILKLAPALLASLFPKIG